MLVENFKVAQQKLIELHRANTDHETWCKQRAINISLKEQANGRLIAELTKSLKQATEAKDEVEEKAQVGGAVQDNQEFDNADVRTLET